MGLKDDFVGTEHLLLALLIERDSRTANVLTLLGAPPDLLRTTMLERASPSRSPAGPGLAPALATAAREIASGRGASSPTPATSCSRSPTARPARPRAHRPRRHPAGAARRVRSARAGNPRGPRGT